MYAIHAHHLGAEHLLMQLGASPYPSDRDPIPLYRPLPADAPRPTSVVRVPTHPDNPHEQHDGASIVYVDGSPDTPLQARLRPAGSACLNGALHTLTELVGYWHPSTRSYHPYNDATRCALRCHALSPQWSTTLDTADGAYYVSIRRGSQWMAAVGPFACHMDALLRVSLARAAVHQQGGDPSADWSYGTARIAHADSHHTVGRLNAHMDADTQALIAQYVALRDRLIQQPLTDPVTWADVTTPLRTRIVTDHTPARIHLVDINRSDLATGEVTRGVRDLHRTARQLLECGADFSTPVVDASGLPIGSLYLCATVPPHHRDADAPPPGNATRKPPAL